MPCAAPIMALVMVVDGRQLFSFAGKHDDHGMYSATRVRAARCLVVVERRRSRVARSLGVAYLRQPMRRLPAPPPVVQLALRCRSCDGRFATQPPVSLLTPPPPPLLAGPASWSTPSRDEQRSALRCALPRSRTECSRARVALVLLLESAVRTPAGISAHQQEFPRLHLIGARRWRRVFVG